METLDNKRVFQDTPLEILEVPATETTINTTLFVLSQIFDKKVEKQYTPVERSTNADSYHKQKKAIDQLYSRGQVFTSRSDSKDFVQTTPIDDSIGNMQSYARKSKISPMI